jgi:KUP system potassium uptake protein
MIVTTTLLSMVWYIVWGFIFIIPLVFLLFFGLVDGIFFAGNKFSNARLTVASVNKFTQGAWFPFTVGVVMTSFMAFWRWGMTKKRSYELDRRVRLRELLRREGERTGQGAEHTFILGAPRDTAETSSTSGDSIAVIPAGQTTSTSSTSSSLRRRQLYLRAKDTQIVRIPGISIYYTTAPTSHSYAPCTFRHFLEHFPTLHEICIFLHVRVAAQPHVPTAQKLLLEASPIWDGVWRGVYRVGYMETPDFTQAEFTLALFEKLGTPVENVTHVLQYTALKATHTNVEFTRYSSH